MVKDTAHAIFNKICDFCRDKGVAPPRWNGKAMNVILTEYNVPHLHNDDPMSIYYALNNRCKALPQNTTLPYLIKALNLNKFHLEMVKEECKDKTNQFVF